MGNSLEREQEKREEREREERRIERNEWHKLASRSYARYCYICDNPDCNYKCKRCSHSFCKDHMAKWNMGYCRECVKIVENWKCADENCFI